VYLGNRYQIVSASTIAATFHCVHCSFESDVVVRAIGEGTGRSAYFLDNEGAQERARVEASAEVKKNVDVTLLLCPCPKCGRRSSTEPISQTIYLGVGIAVAMGLLVAIVASTSHAFGATGGWVFSIASGLLCAWGVWRKNSWKWTTAKDRVRFIEREEEPDVPKKRARRKKRDNAVS
jgi:hypothetical protein